MQSKVLVTDQNCKLSHPLIPNKDRKWWVCIKICCTEQQTFFRMIGSAMKMLSKDFLKFVILISHSVLQQIKLLKLISTDANSNSTPGLYFYNLGTRMKINRYTIPTKEFVTECADKKFAW